MAVSKPLRIKLARICCWTCILAKGAQKSCAARSKKVVNSDNPEAQELIGREIFWDMEKVTYALWENGKIYEVLTDTNYGSRVIPNKTALRVEGGGAAFQVF